LDARLKSAAGSPRQPSLTLKSMEHIKTHAGKRRGARVHQTGIRSDPAGQRGQRRAVSGPARTVWGVMDTFAMVGQEHSAALETMAPGVSAALITTVAGLVVAIPSMFGYNFLVHNLRVQTVELDNFAQELVSKMEIEYLIEE